jgi:hypothetical protein
MVNNSTLLKIEWLILNSFMKEAWHDTVTTEITLMIQCSLYRYLPSLKKSDRSAALGITAVKSAAFPILLCLFRLHFKLVRFEHMVYCKDRSGYTFRSA